ncbi:MAG: hypothetical protein V9E92_07340 [Methylotenera sp.]
MSVRSAASAGAAICWACGRSSTIFRDRTTRMNLYRSAPAAPSLIGILLVAADRDSWPAAMTLPPHRHLRPAGEAASLWS